jgi:hypothetical protein
MKKLLLLVFTSLSLTAFTQTPEKFIIAIEPEFREASKDILLFQIRTSIYNHLTLNPDRLGLTLRLVLSESGVSKTDAAGDAALFRDALIKFYQDVKQVLGNDYERVTKSERIKTSNFGNQTLSYPVIVDQGEHYGENKTAGDNLTACFQRLETSYRAFTDKTGVKFQAETLQLFRHAKVIHDVAAYREDVKFLESTARADNEYLDSALLSSDARKTMEYGAKVVVSSTQALRNLATLSRYDNDTLLVRSCERNLTYYKMRSESADVYSQYFAAKSEYVKFKTWYDGLKPDQQKENVERANELYARASTARTSFLEIHEKLTTKRERNETLNKANTDLFLTKYVPWAWRLTKK